MRNNWYKLTTDKGRNRQQTQNDKHIVACRKCGIVFETRYNEEVCPSCAQVESSDFQRVKDYLWDNPGANMQQVAVACDVPINLLRSWVREGRVTLLGYRLDEDKL